MYRTILGCLSLLILLQATNTLRTQEATALAARLPIYPLDIAVSSDGTAYVVDRNLPGVWQWKEGELSVFYQGSPKYRTPLNAPRCIAFDQDGTLLVGDSATRDVYRVLGDGDAKPITGGKIGIPMDLAVAEDGTIYVADLELRRVFRIPAGTSEVEEVASLNPRGLHLDAEGNLWVVSQNAQQLQIVASDGSTQVVVNERTFEFPHQVVVTESGEALVSDGYKKAIWKIPREGEPEVLVEGEPLDNPVGLALHQGELLVVDPRARKVFRLDEQNELHVWFEIGR